MVLDFYDHHEVVITQFGSVVETIKPRIQKYTSHDFDSVYTMSNQRSLFAVLGVIPLRSEPKSKGAIPQ